MWLAFGETLNKNKKHGTNWQTCNQTYDPNNNDNQFSPIKFRQVQSLWRALSSSAFIETVCVSVCMCVCACVRVCVWLCVCMCVCWVPVTAALYASTSSSSGGIGHLGCLLSKCCLKVLGSGIWDWGGGGGGEMWRDVTAVMYDGCVWTAMLNASAKWVFFVARVQKQRGFNALSRKTRKNLVTNLGHSLLVIRSTGREGYAVLLNDASTGTLWISGFKARTLRQGFKHPNHKTIQTTTYGFNSWKSSNPVSPRTQTSPYGSLPCRPGRWTPELPWLLSSGHAPWPSSSPPASLHSSAGPEVSDALWPSCLQPGNSKYCCSIRIRQDKGL